MIDATALLSDARKLTKKLVDDLRDNADHEVLTAEYATAKSAGRTSLSLPQWAEGIYAQVAVSWVLGAIFVRFCEDNGLVPDAWLSGPGNRRDIAREQRAEYLRQNPSHDDRHWLRHIFSVYAKLPATGDVFGSHNPLWLLEPSADGAREILQVFQRINPDTGDLAHDFTDPTWNTRFLGDLYQDLSDHAKKQFALLQTPIFVEEFILDYTLEPAIKTFGLKDTDIIDPTCGSGHFLLGAFDRLFKKWVDAEPGTNRRELARRAVDAVAGVDVNPFAANIARFRLLLAALQAGGDHRLADAPTYPIHIAVGDSLLHTGTQLTLAGIGDDDEAQAAAAHGYSTEDLDLATALLNRKWAAVVGNPPYIVVRDPALNSIYRKKYSTCHRQYSLGVPFTERFWDLARNDSNNVDRAGFIGMITANSFMKREFGKKLIETWMPTHDLTHLIDTSGAYIPGHGTPTVVLFGRSRRPVAATVRAVLGIRGEPTTPVDASKGLVWTSIVRNLDNPGAQTDFVSVADIERRRLHNHPWSIGGGGAADLKDRLDQVGQSLSSRISEIGFGAVTRDDEVFLIGGGAASRRRIDNRFIRPLVAGEEVRDWSVNDPVEALWPYSEETLDAEGQPSLIQALWPWRVQLSSRVAFGLTQIQRGLYWWEYSMFFRERFRTRMSISFPAVATHNHFVLDRGGKVFNRSAPVIKLQEESTEADHFDLLGVLNSSTACFWMKQVFHNKGSTVDQRGARQTTDPFENFYDVDGSKLQAFPLPAILPRSTAASLDKHAQELTALTPAVMAGSGLPSFEQLAEAQSQWKRVHAEMIGLQEQLDWQCYRLYGLVDEDLTLPDGDPELLLGERAFEIVLARRVASGDEETTWFSRHVSTPITELPSHWSAEYRALVERRIEVIENNAEIGLIERPEYKRRWNITTWEVQQAEALRDWLLDRLESSTYWPTASISTVARLSSIARSDADFMTVARLYAGRDDVDVAQLIAELVSAEAVPYLAPLRYKDSGMRKWNQWCETWALQRREDAGEDVGEIPVPPQYKSADFSGLAWKHRGKLDVPKERFVSYPGAETGNDPSLVVGWAGWDHLERARALATWYLGLKRDGVASERLIPLLAGLAELLPWVLQWHNEVNADPALNKPGDQIKGLLDIEMRELGVTMEDLESWRPAASTRGRRRVT